MKIGDRVKIVEAPQYLTDMIGMIGTVEGVLLSGCYVDCGFERQPDFFYNHEIELV